MMRSSISRVPSLWRPEAFNVLGAVYENQGDRENAAKHCRAAWALDLHYKPASHNLQRLTFNRRSSEREIELGG